jgi:hypothetical protein
MSLIPFAPFFAADFSEKGGRIKEAVTRNAARREAGLSNAQQRPGFQSGKL